MIQMLNGFADHLDLKHVLNPHEGGLNLHQAPDAIEQEIVSEGHCSVIIKVRSFDVEMNLHVSSFHCEIAFCLFNKGNSIRNIKHFSLYD